MEPLYWKRALFSENSSSSKSFETTDIEYYTERRNCIFVNRKDIRSI